MNKKITLSVLILALGIISSNLQAQDSDSIDIKNYQIAVITVVDDSLSSGYTEKRDSDSEPFVFVEQMPQFPGGEVAMFKYLVENLKYPNVGCEHVEGRVIVRFIVANDGTIHNPIIIKSVHPALDKEALRIVKSMPRWIPGQQNGVDINSYFTLPFVFRLSK